MLVWILKWVSYVRWGIVALVGIMTLVLSSVDAGSWPFWLVLAIFVGAVWFSRRALGKIFTGGWRIALILGAVFLVWVIFFRAWPVAKSAVSSWWGSAKASVASSPASGQQAPAVDITAPALPTSQIVATAPVAPAVQPTTTQVIPSAPAVPSAVQPSSSRGGGRSLDELMSGGASEEALAMTRRLKGDGQ